MTTTTDQTLALLARHHRDGEHFAQMVKDSFHERFDENFWAAWDHWIGPVLPATPTVLDLGAGPGQFVAVIPERYPGATAVGIEYAPYMLAAAVAMPPGATLISQDLHDPQLPLASGSVDAVLASVVLHEMTQPIRALQEMGRCLRPGGRAYILDWVRAPLATYVTHQSSVTAVFDPATPTSTLEDLFTHFIEHNRFTVADLAWMLDHTGFDVIHQEVVKEGRYARLVAQRR